MNSNSIGSKKMIFVLAASIFAVSVFAGPSNVRAEDLYTGFGGDLYSGFGSNYSDLYTGFGSNTDLYSGFGGSSYDLYSGFGNSSDLYTGFSQASDGCLYSCYGNSADLYSGFGSNYSDLYTGFGSNTDLYSGFGGSSYDLYSGFGNSSDLYTGFGSGNDLYTGFGGSSSDLYTGFGSNIDLYTGFGGNSSDLYTGFGGNSSDLYTGFGQETAPVVRQYYQEETAPVVHQYYQDETAPVVHQYYNPDCGCYTTTPTQTTASTVTTQQVYSQACGCYTSVPSYGPSYAQSYVQSYMPSYAQQYAPYVANPIISGASYPSYSYAQPTYQQPRQTTPSYTSNTSNYCTGNSCNTSIVDNSINGSFNDYSVNGSFNSTAPIYTATAQPIVSYQFPSYYPSYNYNQGAYCTISASPTSVANGQASILTWSSNGTSAWLSDGIGSVAANGSLAVRPNTTRTYVLTVNGYNGSNTCSVTISVSGTAPYVSLSQIPYTGFDLGVIGNTIYWFALAAFAAALAYLVLYFRGGAFAFAQSFSNRSKIAATHVVAHETHEEAHTSHELPVHSDPVHEEVKMKDTMMITRDAHGAPRIVIQRV